MLNSKTKSREVIFSKEGNITGKLWKNDKEVLDEEHDFHSENLTLDPITAGIFARTLPIKAIGDEFSFDVFNGKHRFLVTLKVAARQRINVAGQSYDAFKVEPSAKKLTDTEGEKRLRYAAIWVSDDDRRDVLKLESKVLLGSISAELAKYEPYTPSLDSTVRASLNH